MPFLYYYTYVPIPISKARQLLPEVEDELAASLRQAFTEFCTNLGARDTGPQDSYVARVGSDSDSEVRMMVGWTARDASPVPSLNGELVASAAPEPGETQLRLQASCATTATTPPWAEIQRAGEAAMKHFGDSVGALLQHSPGRRR